MSESTTSTRSSLRGPLVALVVLASAFALHEASQVVAPLTLALLLGFLLRPVIRLLGRIRVPPLIASSILVVVLMGGAIGAATQLWEPVRQWLQKAPQVLAQLEDRLRPVREPMEQVSQAARGLEQITEVGGQGGGQSAEVRVKKPGLVQAVTDRAGLFVAEGALTISFLFFVLAFGDELLERIVRTRSGPDESSRVLEAARATERSVSTYLATLTLVYAVLGTATSLAMWAAGMPHPVLWGLVAAVLNFVPYLGPLACLLVIGAVSLVTFDDPLRAMVAPGLYLVLTTVEGNLVTPVVLGRRFAINPLVLFTWVFVWAWMWGVAGALVAVPLLTTLKLVAEQIPSASWIVKAIARD